MENINQAVDTFLDAEAMNERLNKLKTQADIVRSTIEETRNIMDSLKSSFDGNSAARLQKEYTDIASTFQDFYKFLQDKIEMMNTLTTNIKTTDEE